MSTVIKVENISKQYQLGNIGTGTLSHDINRWWHKIRGKEDPYLKIGEENKREAKGNSNYVWALNNINFEVKQGEVLGIIGRNGAGKSTLLKILSRTTAPSTGRLRIKGRVASLLEVGTGFHPELTGRENVYLNGAIMGMTKREITNKFDEIIDFAGVERYIDTPVKRYSSGMYVRLAFGVAAHLEPEILIVDEVLAVGDAEFQKKCLGKMKDVSTREGRTVLFVSHNLDAIKTLCNKAMLLQYGRVDMEGTTGRVLNRYLEADGQVLEQTFAFKKGSPSITFVSVNKEELGLGKLEMTIGFQSPTPVKGIVPGFVLYNSLNVPVFGSNTRFHQPYWDISMLMDSAIMQVKVNDLGIHSGTYKVSFWLGDQQQVDYDMKLEALIFEYHNPNNYINIPDQLVIGSVDKQCRWEIV